MNRQTSNWMELFLIKLEVAMLDAGIKRIVRMGVRASMLRAMS